MREELEAALERDFPQLFSVRGSGFYGFECDDGWEPIIRRLSKQIAVMVSELPATERERVFVCQVKAKFGQLRYYISGGTPAMHEATEAALKESERTCEVCGEPGRNERRGNYWLATRCEAHKDVR